jgi:excinuclease UvrABC nuclease subunit
MTHVWALPDVVVIDSGPGQLGAAIQGMGKANIFHMLSSSLSFDTTSTRNDFEEEDADEKQQDDNSSSSSSRRRARVAVAVYALARHQEKVFVFGREKVVNDAPDSPALLLLRSLGDESHRFALHGHWKRRLVVRKKSLD